MAWVIKLSVLLVVLIRTVQTEPDIRTEGESYNIRIPNDADYCLVSRSSEEETLLLWNTSNPLGNSTLTGNNKDRLELNENLLDLRIIHLTQSDSGQYKTECWKNGSVSYQVSTDLLVCGAEETRLLYTNPGDTVELQCEGKRDGDDMTVRWIHCDDVECRNFESKNSSALTITNISNTQFYSRYSCLLLQGHVCVSRHVYVLNSHKHYVGRSVGEEAVLPCFNHDDPNGTETRWFHSGNVSYMFSWDSDQLTGIRNQRYVSDGRTSGNFSLVFPSLMLNHSEWYYCYGMFQQRNSEFIAGYELLVCPKSEPITEYFSVGEEVVLSCNSGLTESDRVVWYRQTDQVGDAILDTVNNLLKYPDDVEGRINASAPYSFLVLSIISLADSGEYWCAVSYKWFCVSVTKTVLVEWDPFGINSTFYRVYSSLMVCALLVMVCVLITVNLKTRKRDQEERPGFPEDQEDFSLDTETEEQSGGGKRRE